MESCHYYTTQGSRSRKDEGHFMGMTVMISTFMDICDGVWISCCMGLTVGKVMRNRAYHYCCVTCELMTCWFSTVETIIS